MSKRALAIAAAVMAGSVMGAKDLQGQTVAVGDAACQTELVHYATIQQAVDSVAPGGTVLICAAPVPYSEQILIDKPITLKGVAHGNSGIAIIGVPSSGLVPSTASVSGLNVAAQILARNISNVTISNLTMDGSGSGCPAGVHRTAGIVFDRVGKAVVQGAVVRNQVGGCGEGVLAEGSNIAIESSSIHDINFNGIRQLGGSTRIHLNDIHASWNGQAGIWLSQVSSGLISLNMIQSFTTGVQFNATKNVIVTGNTLGPWLGSGVLLGDGASGNTIALNRTSANWYGVLLDVGAANNTVTRNTFVRAGSAGVADWSAGFSGVPVGMGNKVTYNWINEAPIGIYDYYSGDVFDRNTFTNVAELTYPSE